MHDVILQFSERVSLGNAMTELARHRATLEQQLSGPGASGQRVVADLSSLKDVDTSALSLILHLDRHVRGQIGRPLVIRSAPANLVSLARLSSLSDTLHWET
jgi:ABC-type transporter Mla MlaB component